MTPDLIDRAFLGRRASSPVRDAGHVVAPGGAGGEVGDGVRAARGPTVARQQDHVLAALLELAEAEWTHLAARVDAALDGGGRVIALAGRERAEGRTTVARGLVQLLRMQGRDVVFREGLPPAEAAARDESSARSLIADAGVWFPPGPVHRGRLARAALGCHAVILVRTAARPACPAHEQALHALGVPVLGEIVTRSDAPPLRPIP